MEINIFDVAHGFCTYVVADNRNCMLIDCGYNDQTGFRPSNYLTTRGCTGIEKFIVTNYDEDHLSDLPNLRRHLPIQVLHCNRSINTGQLARLKRSAGPIQAGIASLLDMMDEYVHPVVSPPEFPGIELTFFSNGYPDFEDTNNLSLVTFLDYRDVHIVFPGDLEQAGWLALLRQLSFRERLRKVNFFVASHHGRQSGYCPDVFDYCRPELVIISDEPIIYETQITDYRQHATGIPWEDHRRYVLTTRTDGMITIQQSQGERPFVYKAR